MCLRTGPIDNEASAKAMDAPVSPDDIDWSPSTRMVIDDKRCPVCNCVGGHSVILTVPALEPRGRTLTLIRCSGCASAFYEPPDIANFSDIGHEGDESWRFYVEIGGGVWETVWPILAAADRGSLLDVGCGFGFALDFWQRTGRGEAVGLELADYGREGARQLGVTIHAEMLQDCKALAGRRFDVVYASEVIEHVPDPSAFVALLSRWVADDGVLIMTTPAGSFIRKENQPATLLAALSPGLHGFLLSSEAFTNTARHAGFAHVEILTTSERQFLWASRRPLRVRPMRPPAREAYLGYLAGRVATPTQNTSPVWQGLAYRLGKEFVGVGRLAEGKEVLARLLAAVEASFGADAIDPVAALARLKSCTTLAEYGRAVPYFSPSLFYFLGALAQHHDRDVDRAMRYYAGAVECTLESGRLGPIFLEALSLLWPARARQAELLIATGDIAGGVDLFVRLVDEGVRCEARNAFALASRDLLESTVPTICEGLWGHGYRDHAQRLFARYKAYLSDRYGVAITTADGVEERLRDAGAHLPLDPLFAPFFAARANIPGEEALAEAAAVIRTGEANADHPVFGPRLRKLADHARLLESTATSAKSDGATLVWSSTSFFQQRTR
jgi:SAM-dependent methyltransferase